MIEAASWGGSGALASPGAHWGHFLHGRPNWSSHNSGILAVSVRFASPVRSGMPTRGNFVCVTVHFLHCIAFACFSLLFTAKCGTTRVGRYTVTICCIGLRLRCINRIVEVLYVSQRSISLWWVIGGSLSALRVCNRRHSIPHLLGKSILTPDCLYATQPAWDWTSVWDRTLVRLWMERRQCGGLAGYTRATACGCIQYIHRQVRGTVSF
jgi:hypothetical protein